MAVHKIDTVRRIDEYVNYAKQLYSEADRFHEEVVKVLRGDYAIPQDLQDTDIELARPSKPANILTKYLSMLAIRSAKTFSVATHDRTQQEEVKADRLELGLHAWYDMLEETTQRNMIYDSAYFTLVYGRAPVTQVYDPRKDRLKIRVRTPHPLTTWPVMGENGVEWMAREYWKPRLELAEFYEDFDSGDPAKMFAAPDLMDDPEAPALSDSLQVKEYWDEKWHAFVIDNEFYGPFEHDYGFVPCVQTRINSTPEDEMRWAQLGLLGYVLEDLKHYAAVMGKQATGVEQFYYPRLYFLSEDGHYMAVDHHTPPGEWVELYPGVQPIILTPSPNHEMIDQLKNELATNISQGTLPEIVYVKDIPNVSGFQVAQIMSLVRDAISEKLWAIEQTWGYALGGVLRLHEKFAPLQPDGLWRYPVLEENRGSRKSMESLSQSDIAKHYKVTVTIRPALPQDKLQMATTYHQLGDVDPATGRPSFDRRTRLRLSGLDEIVGNISDMDAEIEWEYAIAHDEELKALDLQHIKAKNEKRIIAMEKEIERAERKQARQAERQADRAIDEGMESPLIIPPDRKLDPATFQKMAELVAQGQNPALALEPDLAQHPQPDQMGMEGMGGMPGMPMEGMAGMQPGNELPDEELQGLLRKMAGMAPLGGPDIPGAAPQLPQGDGFTGYEGIAPAQLPPAMQGAIPRKGMDAARLLVEGAEEDQRRGALPPPK